MIFYLLFEQQTGWKHVPIAQLVGSEYCVYHRQLYTSVVYPELRIPLVRFHRLI